MVSIKFFDDEGNLIASKSLGTKEAILSLLEALISGDDGDDIVGFPIQVGTGPGRVFPISIGELEGILSNKSRLHGFLQQGTAFKDVWQKLLPIFLEVGRQLAPLAKRSFDSAYDRFMNYSQQGQAIRLPKNFTVPATQGIRKTITDTKLSKSALDRMINNDRYESLRGLPKETKDLVYKFATEASNRALGKAAQGPITKVLKHVAKQEETGQQPNEWSKFIKDKVAARKARGVPFTVDKETMQRWGQEYKQSHPPKEKTVNLARLQPYNVFVSVFFSGHKAENPNADAGAIMKKLGEEWKDFTADIPMEEATVPTGQVYTRGERKGQPKYRKTKRLDPVALRDKMNKYYIITEYAELNNLSPEQVEAALFDLPKESRKSAYTGQTWKQIEPTFNLKKKPKTSTSA